MYLCYSIILYSAVNVFIFTVHNVNVTAGDNFVHRLVQNKADGKLVAAEGAPHDDKLDAAQLEFTYILTRQLDGQRAYYEERIAE